MRGTVRAPSWLRRKYLVLLGATLIAVGVNAPSAMGSVTWLYGSVCPGCTYWGGTYSAMRASYGWSDGANHKVAVAASQGWPSFYGSFVDGFGYACHSYAGSTQLLPVLNNPHSVGQNPMQGRYNVVPESAC